MVDQPDLIIRNLLITYATTMSKQDLDRFFMPSLIARLREREDEIEYMPSDSPKIKIISKEISVIEHAIEELSC